MDEIKVLRQRISQVDEKVVELIKERFELTDQIGKIKRESDLPIEDKEREKIIFDMLKGKSNGTVQEALIAIYKQLLIFSKQSQIK